MDCPNGCGTIHSTNYRDLLIDVCPECVGVWLGPNELQEIALQPARNWPAAAVEATTLKIGMSGVPAEEQRDITCPECAQTLRAINYDGSSGVIINACPSDHGYWLDGGEMSQLQIYMAHLQSTLTALGQGSGEAPNGASVA